MKLLFFHSRHSEWSIDQAAILLRVQLMLSMGEVFNSGEEDKKAFRYLKTAF